MKNKIRIILIILILIIVVFAMLFFVYFLSKDFGKNQKEKVPITETQYQHKDSTMGDVVKPDTNLKEAEGYYGSNSPKRGDLVILKFDGRADFLRKIVAVPGDRISFDGPNLKVNGSVLKNSLGEPFLVADTRIKSFEGRVPKDSYFVLSDESTPAAFDSREFGFVKEENLKGKIIQ